MRILFITTMTGWAWGGSEELWSQVAVRLAGAGHTVFAYSARQPPYSPKFTSLAEHGITLRHAPAPQLIKSLVMLRLFGQKTNAKEEAWVIDQKPDLVVISQGGNSDGIVWMEFCRKAGYPYCSISQCNNDFWWVEDATAVELAARYREARGVYCVSRHNLRMLEWQIGETLPNAKVVWNPNKVSASDLLPWPAETGKTRLASVARLDPPAKGQDMLFQILALPAWRARPMELNLYGAGPYEKTMRKMVERLELKNVNFCGHVANVADVWRENHALVLPSRQEGMALAQIEAMSCGRPVVATDVGGNAELCVDGETGFIASAAAIGPFNDALERAWVRRADWPILGHAAHLRVRQIVPADPVGDLCGLITACVKAR